MSEKLFKKLQFPLTGFLMGTGICIGAMITQSDPAWFTGFVMQLVTLYMVLNKIK